MPNAKISPNCATASNRQSRLVRYLFALCVFLPQVAFAHVSATHTGADAHSHPVLGIEHLVILLVVGVWAYKRKA